MVGGLAVVTDERSDVGDNRTVAASVGDFSAVSRVVIEGEERCWHSYNRFGDISVMPLFGMGQYWVRYTSCVSWKFYHGKAYEGRQCSKIRTGCSELTPLLHDS